MKKKRFADHRQLNCPNCGKFVLSPPARLDAEINKCPGRCCWCGQGLTFIIMADNATVIRDGEDGSKDQCKEYSGFNCDHIGLSVTTEIIVREVEKGQWEARAGFAMLGQINNPASVGANPFDEFFHDNYAIGKGSSVEEAIANLKKDIAGTAATL